MKTKIILFFIGIFSLSLSFAQDTVERKNKLSDSVTERFYVLKSDPTIKQGLYKATFRRKTYIALGSYKNGVKTGIWQFFDTKGRLIEKYNFNTRRFTFEAPLFPSDNLNFLFDDTLKQNDRLTRPLKIGGSYYGFIPYMSLFEVPFDTFGLNMNYFDAYIELLISPLGRLADYKVYLNSYFYNYTNSFNFDVDLFSEEDKIFLPATLNGSPILSRIIIKCKINDNGRLDFY